MQSKSIVDLADQISRKRAIGVAVAAGVFLLIQVVARPFFLAGADSAHLSRLTMWAINAAALLLLLATGGGLVQRGSFDRL